MTTLILPAFFVTFLMVGAALSLIEWSAKSSNQPFITEAQKWQSLIGAVLGFTGVIIAFFFNAYNTDRLENNKRLLAFGVLADEAEQKLSDLNGRSKLYVEELKKKSLLSESYDKRDCGVVSYYGPQLIKTTPPILFPEARKEFLQFPPGALSALVKAYDHIERHVTTLRSYDFALCTDGKSGKQFDVAFRLEIARTDDIIKELRAYTNGAIRTVYGVSAPR